MNEENKVYYGTVVWFNKGFGFVKPDESDTDIFVHYSDIAMEGYKTLSKGQIVSYQIGTNRRGQPKAISVMVIK
jgi:CspA family cold shock protein